MAATRPTTDRLHLTLMLILTFSTGVIDAVGYLGLDRVFTGNMTGNVVLLGMAVAGGDDLPVVRPALALLFFMVGAVLAGRLLRKAPAGWSGRTSVAFGSVAVGTTAIAVVVGFMDVNTDEILGSVITSALATVMGIQAAAAKRLKVAEITTVVVTSTITGLASDSRLAGGKGAFWARRALAILLIGLGAVAGGFALLIDLWVGVAISALLSAVVAIAGHVRYRQDRAALRDAELSEIAV